MKVGTIGEKLELGPKDAVLVLREAYGKTQVEVYIPAPDTYPDDVVPAGSPMQALTIAVRALQPPFYDIVRTCVDTEMDAQAKKMKVIV